MTTDSPARNQDRIVGDVFRLGRVVHHSAAGGVCETEFGEDARPAVVKIRRGETAACERLAARWRDAIELSHPNLLRVYAAGCSVLDDVPVAYAVMERADESLAGVLAERALSEAETRDMLAPTLEALAFLHKKGYAHGSLKPSNILAVGDVLKLASDSVMRTGDGGSPAEDVWALGALIVQALTRKPPQIQDDLGPYILRVASEPFTDVVRHCLHPDPDKRWSVDAIAGRLDIRMVAPAPKEEARRELPVQTAAEPAVRERMHEEPAAASISPVDDAAGETASGRNRNKWIYGSLVAAAVVIAGLIGLGRDKNPAPPAVNPTTVTSPSAAAPIPARPSPLRPPPARTPEPEATPAPPVQAKPTARQPVAKGRRADGWTVVVASYNFRGPAEKRAQELARKWPRFNLNVFEQRADKTYYLVVIGQNLSEDQAEALRKRAVASGLARDAYIKRFL